MQKRIATLSQVIRDEGVRESVRAGANVIRDEMRTQAHVAEQHTPFSTALPPGAMKAGIRTLLQRGQKPGTATAIIGPVSRLSHVAFWVEFGHRLVKGGRSRILASGKQSGSGHEIGEVKPYPFLRPAFEISLKTAIETCTAKMREFFKEVLS